jgi:hypothetical protein
VHSTPYFTVILKYRYCFLGGKGSITGTAASIGIRVVEI